MNTEINVEPSPNTETPESCSQPSQTNSIINDLNRVYVRVTTTDFLPRLLSVLVMWIGIIMGILMVMSIAGMIYYSHTQPYAQSKKGTVVSTQPYQVQFCNKSSCSKCDTGLYTLYYRDNSGTSYGIYPLREMVEDQVALHVGDMVIAYYNQDSWRDQKVFANYQTKYTYSYGFYFSISYFTTIFVPLSVFLIVIMILIILSTPVFFYIWLLDIMFWPPHRQ